MADNSSKTRMGSGNGGVVKRSLGDSGLPKASANPTTKTMSQKGIMSKGGSLGAGESPKSPSLKGFGKGGKAQP